MKTRTRDNLIIFGLLVPGYVVLWILAYVGVLTVMQP